jgi:ABC-type oligopeptide transport system substrate-binding subunit
MYDSEHLFFSVNNVDASRAAPAERTPWFIYMNSHSYGSPLADENLRKALYYGLNREFIVTRFLEGFSPVSGFVPPGSWVGDASGPLVKYSDYPGVTSALPENYGYNPLLALEYFQKAYENNNSQPFLLWITCFEESEEWGLLAITVREWWESLFGGTDYIRILLDVKPMDEAYAQYRRGEYHLGFGAYSHSAIDVWATMSVWSSYYPGKFDGFYNPAFDILQYESTFGGLMGDYAGKIAALTEMERMLLEYMPAIPFFY